MHPIYLRVLSECFQANFRFLSISVRVRPALFEIIPDFFQTGFGRVWQTQSRSEL